MIPFDTSKPREQIGPLKIGSGHSARGEDGHGLAEAGGNLCLLYDDWRFPISADDMRDFGTAREADIYFVNKVYSAVAAKYPNFKILFCRRFTGALGTIRA